MKSLSRRIGRLEERFGPAIETAFSRLAIETPELIDVIRFASLIVAFGASIAAG